MFNGYYKDTGVNDLLKSGYIESPIRYDKVDWYVDEVIKPEKKMKIFFKNTKKDILMTEKDEDFRKKHLCVLWKKFNF